jgi:WD repeat-containing protein 26
MGDWFFLAQALMEHDHEIWQVQFSHRGHMLASASKDGVVIFWEVLKGERRVKLKHKIQAHALEIPVVAWSPDDCLLATCSFDKLVKLWDPLSGKCKTTLDHHSDKVQAAAWLPDGTLKEASHGFVFLSV